LTLVSSPQYVTFDVHNNNCVSSGTFTITWNTGQTSAFDYHAVEAQSGGQDIYTTTATVTSGVFTGDTMEERISENTPNLLDCLVPPGVTSQTGTGTVVIA
jgi:hypothetical protein